MRTRERVIRDMMDHPAKTGLGSSLDNELYDIECAEGDQAFKEDHPDAGKPPCGDTPSYKATVGTSGCWIHHWMWDSTHGEWFQ